MHIVYKINN